MKKISHYVVTRNWKAVGVAFGALLLFIFFSYFVRRGLFIHIDFNTTVRLQDHITRRVDTWFSVLSGIGSFEPVILFLLILLVIRRKLMGFFTLCFFGTMHLVEIFGKTFVSHLPPPEFMVRTQHVLNFPQFYVRLQNSYPSGHMGRALFMTTLLGTWGVMSSRFSKQQKIFIVVCLFLYDIIMAVSRIYLGEHWTSDVIGGSILGFAFGLFGAVVVL